MAQLILVLHYNIITSTFLQVFQLHLIDCHHLVNQLIDSIWITKAIVIPASSKFDINDKTMIENILYHSNNSYDQFNHFQQSPSLALMANQTDQLIKLINLVTTKIIYQIENLLSLHIFLFVSCLPLLLIETESFVLLLPLSCCILTLYS